MQKKIMLYIPTPDDITDNEKYPSIHPSIQYQKISVMIKRHVSLYI